jgi:uncharacterized membrane protein
MTLYEFLKFVHVLLAIVAIGVNASYGILTSLVLYVITTIVAMTLYSPALRRQIALLEAGLGKTDEYAALSKRAGMLGGLLGALVVSIVFLMVTQPTL